MPKTAHRLSRIVRTHWRHPLGAARLARARIVAAGPGSAKPGRAGPPAVPVPPSGLSAVVEVEQLRRADRTVVIVADPDIGPGVRAWIELFRPAAVHVLSADAVPEWDVSEEYPTFHLKNATSSLHALSSRLKFIGPTDVIVNLMPRPVAEHRAMWERLFFHLKPGGWYVIDAGVSGIKPFAGECAEWMSSLLEPSTGEPSPGPMLARELSRSVGQLNVTRELILIRKRQKHWVKLRDAETNRVLASREPKIALTELARIPDGTLRCAGAVISHESSEPIAGLDTTMPYPALHLRHYRGRMAMVSNALVYSDYTILPDSFRHHLENDPKNPRIVNLSPNFARIPADARPHETLPGNYYHLDSENSGHFGHLMTEVMSRMWGWPEAKKAIPDLKAIFRTRYPNERDPALERRIFGAYGIAAEDIVWIDRPVYVESLVAATPMWHNQSPFYVHPRIKQIWDRIGDNIVDPAAPEHPKVFVSRTDRWTSRQCRNQTAVERLFASYGFEILYPELFDIGTQAGIFAKARVIAGFGGSGMFNMLFARNLSTVIVLNHEAYWPRNEHLYTAVLGPDVHYFWSRADPPNPDDRFAGTAYSSWEFDFARNEADLRELLGAL